MLYQGLAQLARTLHRWDLFEHYNQSLLPQFQQAVDLLDAYCRSTVGTEQIAQFARQVEQLAQAIEQVTRAEKPALEATADLLANARRRIDHGQYDDACARLYRALEAVAQFILFRNHNLQVADPHWENQPEPIRKAATTVFDQSLPDKLALYQAWALLWALEDPIAQNIVFPGKGTLKCHFRFQPLLDRRNNSILAHGWNAVTESDVNDLAQQVEQALVDNQPDLAHWLRRFQVPHLPELPLTRPD